MRKFGFREKEGREGRGTRGGKRKQKTKEKREKSRLDYLSPFSPCIAICCLAKQTKAEVWSDRSQVIVVEFHAREHV